MAHVPSFPGSLETPNAQSLALQACDDVESLHVVQRAYACLEKLIGPQHSRDTEEIAPDRTEISALMALVNEELRRRIGAADTTMQSLRVALSGGAAPSMSERPA
jgi:hypothetical protein